MSKQIDIENKPMNSFFLASKLCNILKLFLNELAKTKTSEELTNILKENHLKQHTGESHIKVYETFAKHNHSLIFDLTTYGLEDSSRVVKLQLFIE